LPAELGIERFAEGLDKKIKVRKPYSKYLIITGGNS